MTKLLMKKLHLVALSIAAVLILSRPVQAQVTRPTNSIQTISQTAGGTLLLPYFEVDLNPLNTEGMNTIFTINNTGAEFCFTSGMPPTTICRSGSDGATAVLAHVVIWSDLSVPVFNFNVYLTGYDVETVDMRKVLAGALPRTATAGQDPSDIISPKGAFSQDINFASCAGGGGPSPVVYSSPLLPPGPLTAVQIDNLARSLTGQPSPENGGLCAGLDHGDHVARGYVTIDTVNNCTARFPGDVGYLAAGQTGDVTNQAQLTGEVYYVDPAHSIAYGGNLVPIHADSDNAATSTSGNYTFYGRYDSWTAVDNRQPLATTFAARFLSGPPGQLTHHVPPAPPHELHIGSTSLIVWRDSKVKQGYFTCPAIPGVRPPWYPLGQEGIVAFDEQEHPQVAGDGFTPFSFPPAFPAETQIVKVGGSALPVSFQKGWLFIDLNTTVAAAGANPRVDPAEAQGWVQVVEQDAHRTQSIMHDAAQLDTGTQPNHSVPPE